MSRRALAWTLGGVVVVALGAIAAVRMATASGAREQLRMLDVEAVPHEALKAVDLAAHVESGGDGGAAVTVRGRVSNGSEKKWLRATAAFEALDGAGQRIGGGVAIVGDLAPGASLPFTSTPIVLTPDQVPRASRLRVTIN
jgi:hypothetical protein